MPTTSLYNENELLEQVMANSQEAFGKLFALYRDRVYTVALRLSDSETLAEEIVQDVFLKIWMKRNTLAGIDNFKAYLFIIARNYTFTVMKQLARRQNNQQQLLSHKPVSPSASDAGVLQKDYELILQQAVNRLPPQQKQVYHLSKEEELKKEEIAARLMIAPETVKSHLAQARRSIRAYCLLHLEACVVFIFLCTL